MIDWYADYMQSLGITQTIKERVDQLHEVYRAVCPEDITGIVISDFITEEGLREYESLWFFSASYIMEAKLFVTEDNFDMTPLKNAVTYWKVKKQDYDLSHAGEQSRLHLEIQLMRGITGYLKASRENCDHLWSVFVEYILPNMQTG